MKRITLKLRKCIIGSEYAKEVFNTQIKPHYVKDEKIQIVIPQLTQKDHISPTFVRGILLGAEDIINVKEFYNHFEIKSSNEIEKSFKRAYEYWIDLMYL